MVLLSCASWQMNWRQGQDCSLTFPLSQVSVPHPPQEGDHVIWCVVVCILSLLKDDTELSKTRRGHRELSAPGLCTQQNRPIYSIKYLLLDLRCSQLCLFGRNTNIAVSSAMNLELSHLSLLQVLLWNNLWYKNTGSLCGLKPPVWQKGKVPSQLLDVSSLFKYNTNQFINRSTDTFINFRPLLSDLFDTAVNICHVKLK